MKGATLFRVGSYRHHKFQSAPPVKGATERDTLLATAREVSIRAPREGGDQRLGHA